MTYCNERQKYRQYILCLSAFQTYTGEKSTYIKVTNYFQSVQKENAKLKCDNVGNDKKCDNVGNDKSDKFSKRIVFKQLKQIEFKTRLDSLFGKKNNLNIYKAKKPA